MTTRTEWWLPLFGIDADEVRVRLVIDTTSPAVIAKVERAAFAHGLTLEPVIKVESSLPPHGTSVVEELAEAHMDELDQEREERDLSFGVEDDPDIEW